MIKIKQLGRNLIVKDGDMPTITVVMSEGYNTDRLMALAFKSNNDSKAAYKLFLKELHKIKKPETISQAKIDKKVIKNKIKKLKGFDYTTLPVYLPEDWIKLVEEKPNVPLTNFLLLLSLNKSEFTRNNFLKQFNGKYPYITDLGYLIGVRQVHKVEKNDELYDFIHSSYVKIRGRKKAPSNYNIAKMKDNTFKITKTDLQESENLGNLQELYLTYKPTKKSVYCSNYNLGKKEQESWSIGEVISIDNPAYADNEICGYSRFHIKSNPFSCIGNSDYGNINVITITNPSKLLGIRENWKYTTSETYLACEITDEEIRETFKEDFGHFAYDFANIDLEKIKEEAVENSKDKKLKHKAENKELIKQLKNSLQSADTISAIDFNEILKNRVKLIN